MAWKWWEGVLLQAAILHVQSCDMEVYQANKKIQTLKTKTGWKLDLRHCQTLQPSQVIRFHLRLHMPLSIRHKVQHDPYRWSLANAKALKSIKLSSEHSKVQMERWNSVPLGRFSTFHRCLGKERSAFLPPPLRFNTSRNGRSCLLDEAPVKNRIHSYLIYMLIIVNQYAYYKYCVYIYIRIIWLVLVAGFNPVKKYARQLGSSWIITPCLRLEIQKMVETTN